MASSITKAELARRLGIHEFELVDRAQAAAIISEGSKRLTQETLRAHPDRYPGFWNLSGSSRGGVVLYRADWLSRYKEARDARPSTTPNGIGWGAQEIPTRVKVNPAEAWVHWRSEDGEVRGHSSRDWRRSSWKILKY